MSTGARFWDLIRYGLRWPAERINREKVTRVRTRDYLPSYKVKSGKRKTYAPKPHPGVEKETAGKKYRRTEWSAIDERALEGAYRQNLRALIKPIDEEIDKIDALLEIGGIDEMQIAKLKERRGELREKRKDLPEFVRKKILSQVAEPDPIEVPLYREEGTKSETIAQALKKLQQKSKIDSTRAQINEAEREQEKLSKLTPSELADYQMALGQMELDEGKIGRLRTDEQTYQLIKLPGLHTLTPEEYELSVLAAKLANAAYTSNEDISETLPELRYPYYFHDLTRAPMPTIEGLIGYIKEKHLICLSFKGTDNYQDALTDANFFRNGELVEFNGEKLPVPLDGHEGFIQRFLNISADVINALNKYYILSDKDMREEQKLLITGHSLGGALATVAAFILGQLTSANIQLITFEAPRVFTADTVKRLMAYPPTKAIEREQIRFSARGDIVPTVPPATLGFMHTGRNFYFNNSYGWGKRGSKAVLTHSMSNIYQSLLDYGLLNTNKAKDDYLWLTQGRGIVKKRKGLKRGSAAAKARMAYVRSFRK